MKLFEIDYVYIDLIVGVIFSLIGVGMTFYRDKTVSALLSSNKIFWENIGHKIDHNNSAKMTKIMIPIMGILFLLCGVVLFVKSIIHLLK